MNLAELKARLKEVSGERDALVEKGIETDDDLKAIEVKNAEVETIEKRIEALEKAEASRARQATPAREANPDTVPAEVKTPLTPERKLGIGILGMVRAHDNGERGVRATLREVEAMGFAGLARELDISQRSVSASNASSGGLLIPSEMSNDIIDLLRPRTTFLMGGPRRVPMPNGNYSQPAAASGSTAGYRGEGRPAAVSEPTFKAINMNAKILSSIVPLTDQAVRWNDIDIMDWVRNDMAAAMGVAMDSAAYRGAGTQYTPLGITRSVGTQRIASVASDQTAPTPAEIDSNAATMELVMENVSMPRIRQAWVMAPRTLKYMQNLRDGNSNLVYPTLSEGQPRWRNRPVYDTTQVPINLGVGTDESEMYLIDFGHVLYGDAERTRFAVSDQASVVNGNVTMNAFQDGLIFIKAEAEHDFAHRYEEAVVVLTGVKWGS